MFGKLKWIAEERYLSYLSESTVICFHNILILTALKRPAHYNLTHKVVSCCFIVLDINNEILVSGAASAQVGLLKVLHDNKAQQHHHLNAVK